MPVDTRRCRICTCTDDDCSDCYALTGFPCAWTEPNLCSACVPYQPARLPRETGEEYETRWRLRRLVADAAGFSEPDEIEQEG